MVKKILPYIIFCFPVVSNAQGDNGVIAKPSFKFSAIEKQVPRKTISDFIAQNKDAFPTYTDTAIATQRIEDLYTHLHFLDINNDKLDDVIFEGKDTAEGNIVKLYINNGKGYKQVLTDKQGITGMEFKHSRLTTLVVSDWGCCGAYLNFERTYILLYNEKGFPSLKLEKQTAAVFDGAEPDSLFTKPFIATITGNNIHLRSTPSIDDSSYAPWQVDSIPRGSGNTIGILSKGISCVVLGKKAGNNNWWYVELNEDTPMHRSVFYTPSNEVPTKKRGWIKSDDISTQ